MSERGSFVTEYIYCKTCFEAVRKHLIDDGGDQTKGWVRQQIGQSPIIAGYIGGMYSEEEIHLMEYQAEALAKKICHPVRIAVLADSGEKIITVTPE